MVLSIVQGIRAATGASRTMSRTASELPLLPSGKPAPAELNTALLRTYALLATAACLLIQRDHGPGPAILPKDMEEENALRNASEVAFLRRPLHLSADRLERTVITLPLAPVVGFRHLVYRLSPDLLNLDKDVQEVGDFWMQNRLNEHQTLDKLGSPPLAKCERAADALDS
jgi:hypothetical protein